MTQLSKSRVQWELMLPAEFRAAQSALPVCFLPLGTVEWHGEHNALGRVCKVKATGVWRR